MIVNKVDVVILDFYKKIRLNFEMYISIKMNRNFYLHFDRFSLFLVAFGDI
jgi:hypothetical protein